MTPSPWTLRLGDGADLDAILTIEGIAFSSPWTRRMFEEALQHPGTVMVVGEACSVVFAYALVRVAADEAELLTIAVMPDQQRRGLGRRLLEWIIAHARARAVCTIFLEVRNSNVAAQQLYHRCGFRVLGTRPHYYHHPTEDAVTMSLAVIR